MCAAGRLSWVADVGQVVDVCSWTIVAVSWCWSSQRIQLDDRCGKLRSVESLNACSWMIVAGRSWCWQLGRVESSEHGD